MHRCRTIVLCVIFGAIYSSATAHAHGVIGKRFIPSTIAVDDPFPSDEMDLPTVNHGSKNQEGRETSAGFEFGQRLAPDFSPGGG